MTSREIFDRDYRDICDRLHRSDTLAATEAALRYAMLMCDAIGAPVAEVECKTSAKFHIGFAAPVAPALERFVRVMWLGFNTICTEGNAAIESATIVCHRSPGGSPAEVELRDVELHRRAPQKTASFSLSHYDGRLRSLGELSAWTQR